MFSKVVAPFYIPTSIVESSNFSTSWAALPIICIFHYSHSNGCKVISHCGFDAYFAADNDIECFFVHLLDICISSLETYIFRFFVILKLGYLSFCYGVVRVFYML